MPPAAGARKTGKLRQSAQHDLTVYALAAGAAGVGVLALAQPSTAEIIYTSAHQTIRPNHRFAIDLNHDGITDFTIQNIFRDGGSRSFLSPLEDGGSTRRRRSNRIQRPLSQPRP